MRTLALALYYAGQLTDPKLLACCKSSGITIAAGELSHRLPQHHDAFHAEQAALYRAGLASSPWQHLDDTGTRVHGQHQVCHSVCTPLVTASCTLPGKDRLTVLDVLRDLAPRAFRLNAEALAELATTPLAHKTPRVLAPRVREQERDEAGLTALLAAHRPNLGPQAQTWIRDATAVAAYHSRLGFPVLRLLVCDDAPQCHSVTADLALCWVHAGRHDKKLTPFVPAHQLLLADFPTRFWTCYHALVAYRAQPTPADAARLEAACDDLFATTTGCQALDERIAATRGKREWLLLVLAHPELPLHNNPAELGARQQVRKRDVSYGPRTATAVQAWDTFQSLLETARTLGVSCYAYFADRVRQAGLVPRLDTLITQRAEALHLGASWLAADSAANY